MTTVDAMLRRLAAGDDKIDKAASFAYSQTRRADADRHAGHHRRLRADRLRREPAGEYTFSLLPVVAIALIASWFVAVLFAPICVGILLLAHRQAATAEPGRIMRAYRGFLSGAAGELADDRGDGWRSVACRSSRLTLVPGSSSRPRTASKLIVDLQLPRATHRSIASETAAEADRRRADGRRGRGLLEHLRRRKAPFASTCRSTCNCPIISSPRLVIVAKDVAARERLRIKLDKVLAKDFPERHRPRQPLELGPPIGWPLQ